MGASHISPLLLLLAAADPKKPELRTNALSAVLLEALILFFCLKPAHSHQHKRNPDVRGTQQLVSPLSHVIARTLRHSTCRYMASCLDAGRMTWSHTF